MANKKPETISSYIATFPKGVQIKLQKLRKTIKSVMPKAEEVISYSIACFKLDGKYVVYFAAFKNHISIYPIPRESKTLLKKLAPYIAGRGTLRFSMDKPIPELLVKQTVRGLIKRAKSRSTNY